MSIVERYLEGVHAVVTGGNRGIGAAVVSALASRGARVSVLARSTGAAQLHGEPGADVQAIACDVTLDDSVERAFETAEAKFGPVGILVNNAGAATSAPFAETSRRVWDQMLAVNLTGTYLCTTRAIPGMLAARSGRVVNISSTAGLRGYKTMTAYCAAKHGVIGFTRALALETAKHGVTVNAVCPGYTDTDITETAMDNLVARLGKTREEARAMLLGVIPRGVMTTPEEVAQAVSWLCAPASAAVTGIALPVTGGEV